MRRILVTGAAHGLGRGIAEALLSDSEVVAVDIDQAALNTMARSFGTRFSPVVMNVRDTASVERAFAEITAKRPIDGLVNNAGLMNTAPVADCSDELWNAVLETNLRGAFACARAFARHRIAAGGGGSIVSIISAAAESARVGAGAYSASKAGIAMLTKTLALELGRHEITVNAVAPGLIQLPDRQTREEYRAKYLAMVPLRRLGMPQDIAEAVRFLLSPHARYVHGSTLTVDGGFLAGRTLD